MKTLAIETSHRAGSVALLDSGQVVAEKVLPAEVPTTRSLHPAIRELFCDSGWNARDIQLVVTTVGPGSFTGLRIAVATAKTYAYLTQVQLLGLDTLEVIAHQVPEGYHEVHVAVDAQRGEVVAGSFRRNAAGRFQLQERAHLVRFDQWVRSLPEGAFLTGPALARYPVPEDHAVAILPPELWYPRASTAGKLAWLYWQEGRRDDLWTLLPRYARLSYAEEKLAS
ncbi:MAG: tRNA (adenosine(37)-N6)-threonylcarbamoyltransferase complex dimerization subunit type 1 TsaB [Thermoguttaceae bacterium]|nr:tRNA (adenosine(37)-N6)-threonylcarbamoyltransferase complex dimerization subunit type 1 TsaB [Thermoguttaceae bacterium]MDW8078174.1 tRNA (adenosine(37)-N6)-threonylcarbamoyltransferase complex dimerization subunit type 1 TsaB [Thermoguttaceae bacterium]